MRVINIFNRPVMRKLGAELESAVRLEMARKSADCNEE